MSYPLLYNYRRCPYAMRARMALVTAQIQCEVHDVDFKNKPDHMLEISPKGTVPVLQTNEGVVIDESLDIVLWALKRNDPEGWLIGGALDLIEQNDNAFKEALDRYKYPNRFSSEDCTSAREQGLDFLQELNELISNQGHLMGKQVTIADICIFPFVRQFANVDRKWFDNLPLPSLHKWLAVHLKSELFQFIIKKNESKVYRLL